MLGPFGHSVVMKNQVKEGWIDGEYGLEEEYFVVFTRSVAMAFTGSFDNTVQKQTPKLLT
jgi:hypothetical protein